VRGNATCTMQDARYRMHDTGYRMGGYASGYALPSRMSGFVFDYAGTGRIQDAGLKMWIPDRSRE
jgi:hypothetical protein